MTQLSSSFQQLESGAHFVSHDLKGREKGKLREVITAAATANKTDLLGEWEMQERKRWRSFFGKPKWKKGFFRGLPQPPVAELANEEQEEKHF